MDAWSTSDGTLANATSLACELLLPLKTEKLEAELFENLSSSPPPSPSSPPSNTLGASASTRTNYDNNFSEIKSSSDKGVSAGPVLELGRSSSPTNQNSRRSSTLKASSEEINGSNWPSLVNRNNTMDTINAEFISISDTKQRKSETSSSRGARKSINKNRGEITMSPMEKKDGVTTEFISAPSRRESDLSDSPVNRGSAAASPVDSSGNSVGSSSRTVYTDLSANTIADLLDQGQSVGVYAQSLREILRKMSITLFL